MEKLQVDKKCIICEAVETSTWHKGSICHKCYVKKYNDFYAKNKITLIINGKKKYKLKRQNKLCANCGNEFLAKTAITIYCSKVCACASWGKSNKGRRYKKVIREQKACCICNNYFLAKYRSSKYCSDYCRDSYYRGLNKDRDRKYHYNKYHNDINRNISMCLRSRLNKALKGAYKAGSAVKDLGCSPLELKAYLESKFQPGMSWENRNEWHIDHIIPLSSFDLTNPDELKKACHFSNLQPLWAKDNIKKGNKISSDTEKLNE